MIRIRASLVFLCEWHFPALNPSGCLIGCSAESSTGVAGKEGEEDSDNVERDETEEGRRGDYCAKGVSIRTRGHQATARLQTYPRERRRE